MISPDAKNVMAFMAKMKVPNIRELPIELCRKGLADMMSFSMAPAGCKIEEINAGGPDALWVDASGNNNKATILYLHGGGYTMGSARTHVPITGALSELSQIRVLSVDYRLAPEDPHPAAVQDAVCAYRWLLKQGVSAKSIVIGGDSAGGGLTFATMLELKEKGDPLPAAAFAISPWVDLAATGKTVLTKAAIDPIITEAGLYYMASLYARDADLRLPLISPLYADLNGLPPVLIHVGTSEMLLDDSRRMARALASAGVDCEIKEWKDMFHVFHTVVSLPEAGRANRELAAFIRSHIYKG
ncbi:MAG TPA: alpha/beta hydrolase [Smithella sp.]|nr:alpha/beta hydrolase [Smithella sp.]